MLNLIYKDFKAFNHVLFFHLIIVLCLMSFAFFYDQNGNITYIVLLMYPMILPVVLLILDGKYQTLCNALPISRYNYVLAKYTGGLIFSFAIVGIALLYGYVMTNIVLEGNVEMNPLFSIKGLAMIVMPIILTNSLVFPVFFAFSKEKGSVVLMVILVILLILALLTLVYFEKNLPANAYYSKKDVFPVMIYYLTQYINRIGRQSFIERVVIANGCILLVSVISSLSIFRLRNIGGAK